MKCRRCGRAVQKKDIVRLTFSDSFDNKITNTLLCEPCSHVEVKLWEANVRRKARKHL